MVGRVRKGGNFPIEERQGSLKLPLALSPLARIQGLPPDRRKILNSNDAGWVRRRQVARNGRRIGRQLAGKVRTGTQAASQVRGEISRGHHGETERQGQGVVGFRKPQGAANVKAHRRQEGRPRGQAATGGQAGPRRVPDPRRAGVNGDSPGTGGKVATILGDMPGENARELRPHASGARLPRYRGHPVSISLSPLQDAPP